MTSNYQEIDFRSTDNYLLKGRRYLAQHSSDGAKGIVVVASATGVPQGFYRRFAEYTAEQGFDVITFDYRGIGASAPETLKNFRMDYRDWARFDLYAVIDKVSSEELPIYLVGHSYGGHALGLLDNHHRVKAAYFLGTGAGWHGWMPTLEQWRVKLMWHVIGPVMTRIQGYLGWSKIGMGEDLPLGVYRQWKRWCGFPHYFFDDPRYSKLRAKFAQVNLPIKAVNAIDDNWAMPQSRDAFVKFYSAAPLQRADLIPQNMGMSSIGHMGYFRSGATAIWEDILSYFAEKHAG